MSRSLALGIALLTLMNLAPGKAHAQDATPPIDFVTPEPAECQVTSISTETLATLATPTAGPPDIVRPEDVAAAEPADAATAMAAFALAREATACGNAGDFGRVFALYTAKGLRVFAADRGFLPEQLTGVLAATPVPLPAKAWQGVRVREVRLLPDGRVAAFIDFRTPTGESTVFVALVRVGDRYLVDSEVVVSPAPTTPAATPAP
jgi:hypothetical protein